MPGETENHVSNDVFLEFFFVFFFLMQRTNHPRTGYYGEVLGGGLEKRGSLVGLNLVVNSPEGDRDRGFLHG